MPDEDTFSGSLVLDFLNLMTSGAHTVNLHPQPSLFLCDSVLSFLWSSFSVIFNFFSVIFLHFEDNFVREQNHSK